VEVGLGVVRFRLYVSRVVDGFGFGFVREAKGMGRKRRLSVETVFI
jgi:hypothetical protein